MSEKTAKISVVMATYHPVWEKCVFTLDSIIGQKNIDIELVITDDGSENNMFDEFKSYLDSKGFHAYKFVSHDKNQGTVINYCDGVSSATGQYVKLISPGDALYNGTTLADWVQFLEEKDAKWSFAEAVYYTSVDNIRKPIKAAAAPRLIDCYLSNAPKKSRWNHVVLEDMPLGAAILCNRELFLRYIKDLIGIVKYSEDTAHTAMVYDGIIPAYYPTAVIFYEFGTGISTGDKKWIQRFQDDLCNFEKTLIQRKDVDSFQSKMSRSLARINAAGRQKKRILKFLQKGGIKKTLKYRFFTRYSSTDCSGAGQWWT